jgi:hypothetical protein
MGSGETSVVVAEAAREPRDRWLGHVNTTPLIGQRKHDVTSWIESRPA